MRRPESGLHFAVSVGPGILIHHHDGDGRPERFALEATGKNAAAVFLVARGDDLALAGSTAIEVALDIVLGEFEGRRAPVDDDANAALLA